MKNEESSPSTVLFLCTGNYYRSRFAEILFNTLAEESGLSWRAFSRGLATERGVHNVGPLSPNAVLGLVMRHIPLEESPRYPLQLLEADLQQADLVIALKEDEHRPLVEERFPRWANKVSYWHVDDVGEAPVVESLAEIERQVRSLIDRLSKNDRRV